MPFDITDGRNRYEPCPRCNIEFNMGLRIRGNTMFVWCSECDYEGPKIDFAIPSSETDEKAFNAWNEESRRTI